MTLKENFDEAVAASKNLPSRPDNNTLLKMYSLFKQATIGDADPDFKPGMFDFVASAKQNAWLELKGTSSEDAMQQYLDIYNKLKG